MTSLYKKIGTAVVAVFSFSFPLNTGATVIQIQTNKGDFNVNLFDRDTPQTVARFLEYVELQSYQDTLIHHVAANKHLTGGGYQVPGDDFVWDNANSPVAVAPLALIPNEAIFANVRGTIAMQFQAEVDGRASSQWIVNLADNALEYDAASQGYNVFGQVEVGDMAVLDAINGVTVVPFSTLFTDLPLQDFQIPEEGQRAVVDKAQMIYVIDVIVVDDRMDTADSLAPELTTNEGGYDSIAASDGNGGGALGWLSGLIFGLSFYGAARYSQRRLR